MLRYLVLACLPALWAGISPATLNFSWPHLALHLQNSSFACAVPTPALPTHPHPPDKLTPEVPGKLSLAVPEFDPQGYPAASNFSESMLNERMDEVPSPLPARWKGPQTPGRGVCLLGGHLTHTLCPDLWLCLTRHRRHPCLLKAACTEHPGGL